MLDTQSAVVDMSPTDMLAAVDGYQGTIVDLDRCRVVRPHDFAAGWQALARWIREAGLTRGERAIVAVGNGPLFLAAWAAVLAEGGSPLLVHGDTPPAELKRIAQRFHARFAISDAAPPQTFSEIGAQARTLVGDDWLDGTWADFGALSTPADGRYLSLPGVPLHPTSGTTGPPKVAVRPVATALAEVRHYVQTIGIDEGDKLLALTPMSHAYAHGWCVTTPMVTGADLVTMRRFQAKQVFQACKEQGITILPAVASLLNLMMFGAGNRLYDPHRRVFTGGAPLSEHTALNFERISGTRVRPLYGNTETGAITVAREGDALATGGYVGRPFDGVSVQLRPPPDPSRYDSGIGLVHVRSPSVMAGYLMDEQLERSPVADGWFNTGDLGWLDGDGGLHLRGRLAEVINLSGMKVLPSEVEEVIAAMPGVVEVKVYPAKTARGALNVRAAVVAEDGVNVDQIAAHCAKHLVYYKRPARICMLEALPRSPGGKIQRDALP